MKILATVLLGPGAESSVADAILSVRDRVDGFVYIESGGGPGALEAAIEASPMVTWHRFDWTGSYSDARQFALDAAGEAGADWALTVDCDERVALPADYRDTLAAHPGVHVWNLRGCDHGPCNNASPGHGYCKERLVRANLGLRWHGRVCENIQSDRQGVIAGHFWENQKTPEAERRRYERGVVECQRMIDEGDDRFKWWRHMGSCSAGLGRMDRALECYEEAIRRPHGPEDEARCVYLICELMVIAGRLDEAHDKAALGLARHAGFIPEFGSVLAWVQMQRGDLENASRWAQLVQITPPDRKRIGHRGKECHERAQAVLQRIEEHNRAVMDARGAQELQLGDVVLPITDRFSGEVREAVAAGVYEAAERRMLERCLVPGDRLLELGGGCGYLATVAAKRIGSDAVLTVEADPEMLPTMQRTFERNGVTPKVRIGAVGPDASPRALARAESFWSTKTAPGGNTAAIPLAELVAEHQPSVIVCDIEGGEADLCGQPLPGVRAVIIETHGAGTDQRVIAWLHGEGFLLRQNLNRTHVFERVAA